MCRRTRAPSTPTSTPSAFPAPATTVTPGPKTTGAGGIPGSGLSRFVAATGTRSTASSTTTARDASPASLPLRHGLRACVQGVQHQAFTCGPPLQPLPSLSAATRTAAGARVESFGRTLRVPPHAGCTISEGKSLAWHAAQIFGSTSPVARFDTQALRATPTVPPEPGPLTPAPGRRILGAHPV